MSLHNWNTYRGTNFCHVVIYWCVHVLLSRSYPDFIQTLSRFYPEFIQISSRFYSDFIQISFRCQHQLSWRWWRCCSYLKLPNKQPYFYPDFFLILPRFYLDFIQIFWENSLYPDFNIGSHGDNDDAACTRNCLISNPYQTTC